MDFVPLSPLRRKPKCVAKAKKSYAVFKTLKSDSPSRSPLASPARMTFHHDLGSPTKKKSRKEEQDKFQAQLEKAVKENAASKENESNLPTTPKKSAKGAQLKRKASEIMLPNDKMGKRLSSCGKNVRRNSQQFASNAWNYGRQNLSKALAMRQKSALAMDPTALKVFGKPIEDIMTIQQHIPCLSHLVVPVLIHDTVAILLRHGLSVEGIFRISGSLKMMEGVVTKLNSGELPDIEAVVKMESGVNVVSGLLKKFLRELPEPLMTFALFQEFVDLFEEKEEEMAPSDVERIEQMQALLEKLPSTNYYVLKQLTYLFGKISENEGKTRMTADNIAIVMGPNLLKNPVEDPLLVFHEVDVVKNVVKFMIDHVSVLFNYEDECIVNYETTMGGEIDIRASYRNPDDAFDVSASESDVSERCHPEERPAKKRKIRKSSKSIFSRKELLDLAANTPLPGSPSRVSPSTFNLASSTPLPPSPVKPGLRELAEQTPLPPSPVKPGLRELAEQTPLPTSPVKPGVRELAEQTPLPVSPLRPGVRELAEQTPLPASPLKPGVRELAEQTPLPVSPLRPGVREKAEQTPLPASPLKPGVRELAEQTPLPVSPLRPGVREKAEQTPLPASPLKPGLRELAEQTPLPVSPLRPGVRELAEQTPLPASPLKYGLRELAEQTPLPASPLKPGLRELAEQTPLPASPLKYGLRELAEETPLPPSPLRPGVRELAEQTPLPVSPVKPGVRELAEKTPLPVSPVKLVVEENLSLVRRSLKNPSRK